MNSFLSKGNCNLGKNITSNQSGTSSKTSLNKKLMTKFWWNQKSQKHLLDLPKKNLMMMTMITSTLLSPPAGKL